MTDSAAGNGSAFDAAIRTDEDESTVADGAVAEASVAAATSALEELSDGLV